MRKRDKRYFWLSAQQMRRIQPFFPKVRGRARSDDCKVLSGIIYVKRYGLRWQDAPAVYGPYKTWCDCGGRSPGANEVRYVGLMDISREENDLWNTMSVWMCR